MEIQIIHPTLEDYSKRVNNMAVKYGLDTWFDLVQCPHAIADEDDRDEFAFIYSSMGDQLISREIQLSSEMYDSHGHNEEIEVKPGYLPGLTLLGVNFGRTGICGIN